MEEHITEMSNLVNRLAALGETLKDNLIAAMLLGSLPDSYNALITGLESRSENELTLQLVQSKLIDEYKRRKYTSTGKDQNETAMKIDSGQHSGQHQKITCFFCKKDGHYKKECRKYKAWKEKHEKAKQVEENESCFMTNVQQDVKTNKESCFGVRGKQKKNNAWFVDSGATSHMANYKECFTEFNPGRKGHVRLADEQQLCEIKGSGTSTIRFKTCDGNTSNMEIKNVLYVPELTASLLSVKKLAAEGYKLLFEDTNCKIMKGEEIQATASLSPELYEIKTAERTCTTTETEHNENCQHTWHRRFGHREPRAIKELEIKGLATNIKIKDCGKREICESCIKGKMTRKPFPKKSNSKTGKILDLIHTDVCGPMQTITPGNKKYILTLIDDYSRYTEIYLMQYKSEATSYLKNFIEMTKTQYQDKPKMIRSDRGGEYLNKNLQDYLKKEGIQVQYTTAYSPQQNGVAERKNRSLLEMARCMLFDANLPKKYWGEAVNTANYLQNRLPSQIIDRTPHELWHKEKPNLENLHIFGCKAYAQIPKEHRQKLDEKGEELTFVGYSKESKAFRLLDIKTDRIKISRDVIFLDHQSRITENETTQEIIFMPKVLPNEEINGEVTDEDSPDSTIEYENSSNETDNEEVQEKEPQIKVRRSRRANKGVPPKRYEEILGLTMESEEPTTRKEAMSGPNKVHWQNAMDEEIESLKKQNTWELTPAPLDKDVITCKWVFKIKGNAEGNINKYKARLVARGFSQKYGIDYNEVFAPVVRQTTFRILLTKAGKRGLLIKHFDAKTAFLNGPLKETVYMKQPEGYIPEGSEGMVCKLNKSIYGLKQAAKVWNDQLNQILLKYDFRQSEADPCLYVKGMDGEEIYLIIYVDDFLIAGKEMKDIDNITVFLKKHFILKDLGLLQNYLGIEVTRNSEGFYKINQSKYIQKILDKFGLQDAKPSNIPLDPGYLKNKGDEKLMQQSEKYQQLIGALLYIAVNSRPDIAASINTSQHNQQPLEADWTEAKRVLRYLKGTKDRKLILGDKNGEQGLIGYADADWAENRIDRKSNSGHLFKLFNATISWGCRKQNCVALSSTEAEYIALAEASQEALWIQRLLTDFQEASQRKIIIYEDNQSCLKMTQNKNFSHRTKHVDTKYHYIKDLRKEGIVEYVYCPTEHMLADMLTKPLQAVKLRNISEKCGLSG